MLSNSALYQRLKWKMLPSLRRQRLQRFLRTMNPPLGATILDVGGLPSLNEVPGFWHEYTQYFRISLLNLPGAFDGFNAAQLDGYDLIEGDACGFEIPKGKFDFVFSNALIEHVGNLRRQAQLAGLIQCAGRGYWLQTPSPLFPIEAHCDVPFWWQRSPRWRRKMIRRWSKHGQNYLARQMATTRPIGANRLKELFPDAAVFTEYLFGWPKAHIVYGKFGPEFQTLPKR